MNKKTMGLLAMIAVTVVVLLLNRQDAEVRLGFSDLHMAASFAYLLFTAAGIAIGLLIK
jgi:hypothetical protein